MEHLVKPKISLSRLILTVSITAGIIIYAVSLLTKETHVNRRSEDATMVRYQFAGSNTLIHDSDTTGKAQPEAKVKIHTSYSEGIKDSYLELDSLTSKQIIDAISKYHQIPVI